MKKERPIIMSGNHPKLILDGIKTQTRRVIKDPRKNFTQSNKGMSMGDMQREAELNLKPNFPCPYGQIGDRLWVRETWRTIMEDGTPNDFGVVYKDGGISFYRDNANRMNYPMEEKWRPSIFMPRWASRITLEITGVRVERLQEITKEDVIAEGMIKGQTVKLDGGGMSWPQTYRGVFHLTWDFLNEKRGYGWEKNPWVWVISFRIDKKD